MKKLLMLFVVVVACFFAFACDKPEEQTEVTAVKIGGCGPLSGPVSQYGLAVEKGVRLAVEEINKAGGVEIGDKKVPLELVGFLNDEHDGTKAAAALNTLVGQGANVIVGAVTSGPCDTLIVESMKVGIPVITPTGTADKLTAGEDGTQRADRENVFRACFYDSYQGEFMANYAAKNGVKKAYVLFDNEQSYSVGLKDAFKATAEAQGITVTAEAYVAATSDFDSYWAKIVEGGYDCVYLPDYYEKVYSIMKAGAAKGYTGVCYGADGWDGLVNLAETDADKAFLEKGFYTNHFSSKSQNANVKNFVDSYKAKYNGEEPLSFAALGYDAVYMIKEAVEACDSVEYEDVIKALAEGTYSNKVTANGSFTFKDGNPQKEAIVLTFKDGVEVEAK